MGSGNGRLFDVEEKVREYIVSFDTPREICKGELGYDTMTHSLVIRFVDALFSFRSFSFQNLRIRLTNVILLLSTATSGRWMSVAT